MGTIPLTLGRDLSIIEGAVALALILLVGWAIWTSRKTHKFRAGIFVERDDEDDHK